MVGLTQQIIETMKVNKSFKLMIHDKKDKQTDVVVIYPEPFLINSFLESVVTLATDREVSVRYFSDHVELTINEQ